MFDGSCDQTKELKTLYGSMSNDDKWIISSSGRYMFVVSSVHEFLLPTRFLAKIHNGNHIRKTESTSICIYIDLDTQTH